MVESFVALRSADERRKFPRFPTPPALSGRLGVNGFEGTLVAEGPGSSGERSWNYDGGECRSGADVEKIAVNIADFSESGVQLQLCYSDFLSLQRSSLHLEIENHRFPVQLRWWKQCGCANRGGFLFSNRMESYEFLAKYILALNTKLVDFLMATYLNAIDAFTNQAGVFIYISIYYGLRLTLLEAIARRNTSIEFNRNEQTSNMPIISFGAYSNAYHIAQNAASESKTMLRNALYKYIRPYYDFGCGVIGMNEDVILMKEEVIFAILNSVILTNNGDQHSSAIRPELSFLHSNFLTLKHLLMLQVFEDEIFEIQFEYYSGVIQQIEQARGMVP